MSYHEKLNGEGVGTGAPEHDKSSNCADAFRTGVRAFTTGIVEPNLGQNTDWMDKFAADLGGFQD